MTGLRNTLSSMFLGVTVAGVELSGLGDRLVAPVLGGVVAFAFWLLQRRVSKSAEADAALAATLSSLRNDLTGLRQSVDSIGSGAIALLRQRLDAGEKYDGMLHDRIEKIHDNWSERHRELQAGIDTAGAAATDAKHAATLLELRLRALEAPHAPPQPRS